MTDTAERDRAPITLDRDVAWLWAASTGRAEFVGPDMRAVEDIDTVGEAIVTISNSERRQEDFGVVYKIIARARGASLLSETVLSRMVEAATDRFTPEAVPTEA